MTKVANPKIQSQDVLYYLAEAWRITKIVALFIYKYGSIVLKFVWKHLREAAPYILYFLFAFIAGIFGGGGDALSRKAGPTPRRHWEEGENSPTNHRNYYKR